MAAQSPQKRPNASPGGRDPTVARTRLILWAMVAVGLLVVGALALSTGAFRGKPQVASVGGAFNLVDQTGRPVSEAALNGQWSMVFFGFTFCPDICPGTLQALIRAKDELGTKGEDVRIVFISVDPARDRPAAIKDWLEANDAPAGTLGLTGTQAEVDRAVKAYRAVANKVGDGPAYTMDHSTVVYLMDPRGRFVRPLPYSLPDEIVTQVTAAKRGD